MMTTRTTIAAAGILVALGLGIVALVGGPLSLRRNATAPARSSVPPVSASSAPGAEVHPGCLYGRLTTVNGDVYEGRFRWGRNQEAHWTDYFNGAKADNPWAAYAAGRQNSNPIEILGFRIGGHEDGNNLRRLFMARFGNIARIEPHFRDVQVRLKSGTVITLDRFAAGDIDDGVRVWDRTRGLVDVNTREIRTIEFLPVPARDGVADRLYGTVLTRHGPFTGLIQWDQLASIGSDELHARAADGEVTLRFDSIRSIARQSREAAVVTLLDGREMTLSGARNVGPANRGIYVDDTRYGRVLISWDAFEDLRFGPNRAGPAFDDFSPGQRLSGTVTTRDGRRFTGRVVYDFDESETSETLDAAVAGVDYNVPFSLISAVIPNRGDGQETPHATVILRSGEELQLERTGDLGERNAGLLIFIDSQERPENVPWRDVARVDLVDPPAAHP